MNPRISAITTTDHYHLQLTFTNGEQGVYDCSTLLDFGVFKALKNPQYFRQATVIDGTVCWPDEQDICPDTLYLKSKKL